MSTRNRTDEDVDEIARKTSVYTTTMLCYQEIQFSAASPFKPRAPEECLFSENLEEVRLQFPNADESQIVAIAHDLSDENKRLKRHITKANLQDWHQGILAQVQKELAEGNAEDVDGDITME